MKRIFPEFNGKPSSQPVPVVTPDDLRRVILRDFSGQEAMVTEALNEYGQKERLRVQLAVLKLSNGNLETLRDHVAAARQDFRDVLVAAEYPEYSKRGMLEVPQLPVEEQRRIIESDWAQYEAWLEAQTAWSMAHL